MMAEIKTSASAPSSKTRKLLLQLLLGALTGGVGMFAALMLLDGAEGAEVSPARAFALGTALVYFLTGAMVMLGSLAPSVGEKTLNVEDAEELREQRPLLLVSGSSFIVVAIFVAALTLAGDGETALISREMASVVAAITAVALVVLGIRYRNAGDEMMQAVSQESNGWAVALIFLAIGGWAAAAHLRQAPALDPLTVVAALFALYLLAVFIAAGRRGMLKPR